MNRRLFSYWRSSCSYRVRIALHLKQLDFELVPVNLKPGADAQYSGDYLALNPEARVPFFQDGDIGIGQSLAILDYLEQRYPEPALLPGTVHDRAACLQISMAVAADIQPLNNLSVLNYLREREDLDVDRWLGHWIGRGLEVVERHLEKRQNALFCVGDVPSWADICLIPQLWNARRFSLPLENLPRVLAVEAQCNRLEAFQLARPEVQPDRPQ